MHDSNGKPLLNGERYDLIKIGDAYYSKSILFKTGEYTLEEFIVIDSTDEAIYISPKTGSRLAGFVDDPLPQAFEVQKDSESEVKVQVVPAYLASASDFGYASFPFEVVLPATDTGARLCGTYEEDKQRPGACYDSKECLIGKWRFKGFIGTDSCQVEIPDSLRYMWRGNRRWIVLDSMFTPWIRFYDNDSLAGRSLSNDFFSIQMLGYKIDENNALQLNFWHTDVGELDWGYRFLDSLKSANKFVSFRDTLFLYTSQSKMFFVKGK